MYVDPDYGSRIMGDCLQTRGALVQWLDESKSENLEVEVFTGGEEEEKTAIAQDGARGRRRRTWRFRRHPGPAKGRMSIPGLHLCSPPAGGKWADAAAGS